MSGFLEALFAEGHALVSPLPPPPLTPACEALLVQQESAARLEFPGDAPVFLLPVASWATTLFYQACRFVVCRELGEPEVVRALKNPCPEARSPSADWSVDLLLQRLPTVVHEARHLSFADPLIRELQHLGISWPLSSIGMPDLPVDTLDLDPILSHPGLAQLYVDRVIECRDTSRLRDPRVAALVHRSVGAHPELAPELLRWLSAPEAAAKGPLE